MEAGERRAVGGVIGTVAYDPWGVPVAGPADDPFGYKGQAGYYTNQATGLILCTHSYYDPELGRWLTRDPIGYEGGVNLYGYCGNEPVGGVDPDGLTPFKTGSIPDILTRVLLAAPPLLPGTVDPIRSYCAVDNVRKRNYEGAVCDVTGGIGGFFERFPDYYGGNIGIPYNAFANIPAVKGLKNLRLPPRIGRYIGLTGGLTIDRYGHGYLSGGGFAGWRPGASWPVKTGYMCTLNKPSKNRVSAYINGESHSIFAGGPVIWRGLTGIPIPFVAGYSWNTFGQSIEFGVGSDQGAYSYMRTIEMW